MPILTPKTWKVKPSFSVDLNLSNPLTNGLVRFWPLSEGVGPPTDLFGNSDRCGTKIPLSLNGGAYWVPSQCGGFGLLSNVANAGAQAPWPTNLNYPWPITLITCFTVIGIQTGSGLIFGLYSGPIFIFFGVNQVIQAFLNASFNAVTTFSTVIGKTYVVAYEQQNNSAARFYINGSLITSINSNVGAATYSNTNVAFGDSTSFSARKSGIISHWGGIWNTVLSPADHAIIGSDPNAIFQILKPRFSNKMQFQTGSISTFFGFRPLIGNSNLGLIGGNIIIP